MNIVADTSHVHWTHQIVEAFSDLCILEVFNVMFIRLGYVVSNDRMISESLMGVNVEGSSYDLM